MRDITGNEGHKTTDNNIPQDFDFDAELAPEDVSAG
jgi:hypothetical protein